MAYYWWTVLLALILFESSICAHRLNVSSLVDNVLNNQDKRFRPNFGGPPVQTGISMYIINIDSISEINMDFSLDMYFRQHWDDQRLAFYEPRLKSQLIVPPNSVWEPDTFFTNAKNEWFHSVLQPNTFNALLPNGTVLSSVKVSVTASCSMNLSYFPMDTQVCNLDIESYGHNMSDIVYKWQLGSKSVGLSPDIVLAHYQIIGHRLLTIEEHVNNANYSRLRWEFVLKRSVGPYIVQLYFPAILLVILSWLPFWFGPNEMTARSCVAIVVALAMIVVAIHADAELPPSTCIKTIDLYLGSCITWITFSLIQLTMVFVLKRRQEDDTEVKNEESGSRTNGILECSINVETMDNHSRRLFPISFACFNISYWITLRIISKVEIPDLLQ